MDLEGVLEAPDIDLLTGPVRRLLDDDRLHVESCEIVSIDELSGNPTTLGVHRVRGVASGLGGREPFSLIRKVIGDIELPYLPRVGYSASVEDWNYWKREALAFASGIVASVDGPILPVRCVGVDDRDDHAVIWLEEVRDDGPDVRWPVADLVRSSAAMGEINGRFVGRVPRPEDHPWLLRDFVSGWLRTMPVIGSELPIDQDDLWRSAALRGVFPVPLGRRIRDLLADADALLDVGHLLPTTLTHHDAFRHNLFRTTLQGDMGYRLIDWSLLGIAPVGEELGHQVGPNVFHLHVPADAATLWDYEEAATGAYLNGLRKAGVDVSPDVVRIYARAVAALQIVTFASAFVSWLAPDDNDGGLHGDDVVQEDLPWPTQWANDRGLHIDDLLRRWACVVTWLLDLGDAARRDAETVGTAT